MSTYGFCLDYLYKFLKINDLRGADCCSGGRNGGHRTGDRAAHSCTNRELGGLRVNLIDVSNVDSLEGIGATMGHGNSKHSRDPVTMHNIPSRNNWQRQCNSTS